MWADFDEELGMGGKWRLAEMSPDPKDAEQLNTTGRYLKAQYLKAHLRACRDPFQASPEGGPCEGIDWARFCAPKAESSKAEQGLTRGLPGPMVPWRRRDRGLLTVVHPGTSDPWLRGFWPESLLQGPGRKEPSGLGPLEELRTCRDTWLGGVQCSRS